MSRAPLIDNSTFDQKVMLRMTARQMLWTKDITPVVMETHGGLGDVYGTVYTDVAEGVVFEKDGSRTAALAHQRPSWAVYEADCETAVALGAGGHLRVNLLDVDPYGAEWPVIRAFFNSPRPYADYMVVVVNSGLRHKLRTGGGWDVDYLADAVAKYGNHNMWARYLDVCADLLEDAARGYTVEFFDGYYTGIEKKMTHWLAALRQDRPSGSGGV